MVEKKKKRIITKENPADINPISGTKITKESKNNVICIIGMHRSGTSMITQLLNMCGLDLGPSDQLLPGNESNLMGYFENEKFTYKIDETLLTHFGGSWDNPPLYKEGWELDPSLEEIYNKAKSLIESFSKSSNWGWKDPRATILLPFWKSLIPNLRFVICVRSPLEVAQSLYKRDSMPIHKGVYLWNQYMKAAIRDTENCARIFVFYEDFFQDATFELKRLVEFCGLREPDNQSILLNTISKKLKHHTSETYELLNDDKIVTEYKIFYIALRALTNEKTLGSISDISREELVSKYISNFNKLLEEFHDEQTMAQLQRNINIYKVKVEGLEVEREKRENYVENLEKKNADKEDHVENLEKIIADKEENINNLTNQIAKLEHFLAERENQISYLKNFEAKVKSTLLYKIYQLLRLHKIYNKQS